MKKFLAFLRVGWQDAIAYRTEGIVWMILETIPVVYMLSLWNSLEIKGNISADKASALATYYVLTLMISRITAIHFEEGLVGQIKDGSFSKVLVKPFSLWKYLVAEQMSWKTMNAIYIAPVLLIFGGTLLDTEWKLENVGLALLIMFFVVIQKFMASWMIAMLSFWMSEAKSITHFKWMLEGILGGAWLPLNFFPEWFVAVASKFPFYGWYYFPIKVATGEISGVALNEGAVMAVVWAIVMVIVGKLLWEKAIESYSANGG